MRLLLLLLLIILLLIRLLFLLLILLHLLIPQSFDWLSAFHLDLLQAILSIAL